MSDLVRRACEFATAAHARINHRRKYTALPYDVHLRAVAERVASVCDDPALIAAAWLHDTVEDTPTTVAEIQREFGPDVATLVSELTDVSRPGEGNRAARKALDRQHLSGVSARAKTVKLADIIDNCADICRYDSGFGRVYLSEARALLEVLREGDPRLHAQAAAAVEEWSERIGAGASDPLLGLLAGQHGLRLFVTAFTARDILEPLPSCDAESLPGLFGRPSERPEGLIVGVRTRGRVSGYLLDSDFASETLPGVRPIAPEQRLTLDSPLADVVRVLSAYTCGFITANGMIVGVVTRADIEKPVVRMWLFGIIMLFEMLVVRHVRSRWPEGGWLGLVSEGRLEKAKALQEERVRRGQKAELLDCLQFSDKFQLVIRDSGFVKQAGFPSAALAKKALKELESLRNDLAHGQDIAEHDWPSIVRLAQRIQHVVGSLPP